MVRRAAAFEAPTPTSPDFLANLDEFGARLGPFRLDKAVVLGAGGAARAVIHALFASAGPTISSSSTARADVPSTSLALR